MLPVDLALRVNYPTAAICLMELRLRALSKGPARLNTNNVMSRRPELALFSGWDNDLMRCEVLKTLMEDEGRCIYDVPYHFSNLTTSRRSNPA